MLPALPQSAAQMSLLLQQLPPQPPTQTLSPLLPLPQPQPQPQLPAEPLV
jgi:hypothetical protein